MNLPLRGAAVLLWFDALGFGIPCVMAIRSLLSGQGIPMLMGFPAYGGGPFESHGIQTTVPLVVAFLVVCVLEGVAGWLLWGGHREGAILAFALLPFGALFWWGFALPIPPLFAIVRSLLILLDWRSLH
ncbi:MAG: hypothetical protein QOE92_2110 [Chloroflexota bacterium]|jgi:hypothetical protein|nr:hypothetical protein [Chloroflexota bacterium]